MNNIGEIGNHPDWQAWYFEVCTTGHRLLATGYVMGLNERHAESRLERWAREQKFLHTNARYHVQPHERYATIHPDPERLIFGETEPAI
jgi:hypothetical protein